jgi:hypothetical protein
MQHRNQFLLRRHRPDHLPLTVYFEAGLVAGTAAFSSLAGVLFAGFATFLASALCGAAGAVTAGVAGLTSTLAGSAANAVTANKLAITVAINFMIFPFLKAPALLPAYIYNALARNLVDKIWTN